MVLFGPIRSLHLWIGGGVLAVATVVTVALCLTLLPVANNVPNLLDLSAKQRREYFASFDLVLSDCDGTVWQLTDSIPGAGAGVSALQAIAKPVIFVSNNALRPDASYLRRFAEEGINATMADVMHPGIAIVDYLRQTQFEGLIYTIGSKNLRLYLRQAGHELVKEESRRLLEDSFEAILAYAQDDLPVRAVVLDWDHNTEFKEFLRAEAYLKASPDVLFLVGATDMELPFAKPTIGPGVIVRMLEQVVGRSGVAVGKPGAAMREVVMRKFGVTDPRRILFIGDTLVQDIQFGKKSGFQTLAVLTGSATLESIAAASADDVPDYYLPSFADFVELCKDA